MRDFREAKAMARSLRTALDAMGFKITVDQSLELIACSFGVTDWNTLAAAIRLEASATAKHDSRSLPKAGAMFVGPKCGLCTDQNWDTESKRLSN